MDICHIEEYWSSDAKNYGKIVKDELNSFRKEAWKALFQQNIPVNTKSILDIGCGPGFFSVLLAEMDFEVTGIDCSEKMLEKAKQNTFACDFIPHFIKMDCEKLDFPDNKFDVVVSRNVTWTLREPEKAYKEWQRVLRPGGKLLVFDANWHLHLYDKELARCVKNRYEKCFLEYGDAFENEEELPTNFNPKQLPLSFVCRPAWDARVLNLLEYEHIETKENIIEKLWSDKEKLLYGESPLFLISACKQNM